MQTTDSFTLLKGIAPHDVLAYLIEEDPSMRAVIEVGLELRRHEEHQRRARRDRFAAAALQGLLATAEHQMLGGLDGYEPMTAAAAFKLADAMIAMGDA